jgi:hypothetical protein
MEDPDPHQWDKPDPDPQESARVGTRSTAELNNSFLSFLFCVVAEIGDVLGN